MGRYIVQTNGMEKTINAKDINEVRKRMFKDVSSKNNVFIFNSDGKVLGDMYRPKGVRPDVVLWASGVRSNYKPVINPKNGKLMEG